MRVLPKLARKNMKRPMKRPNKSPMKWKMKIFTQDVIKQLPVDIKILLKKLVKEDQNQPKADNPEEPPQKIRARCLLCGRAKNRVTTMKCDSVYVNIM
ncbi:unnamed protein product [Acanthoscelides obtectus]|uniref:Uncharacterized protein n=1 Tax=Acanthoscelides obtectus TaxID=200917 RepID=A0A9P0PIE2_ACAOB|nr:unnamed protein product [Acanthoscelides obtectus]CAK1681003.1 hypothetical protein AOBTE_LOCUS32973 [Acanthoscelides obtectus]